MAKKITVIPSVSESLHTQMKPRIRVCGYARVSTASMAQADSYAAQVGYYTEKIQSNPLWEFAGVYADEGITGTKAKGRYDFNEMIAACEDGDIDLILTKSITRFARNTVDCIQTIRKLKAIGVGITFEKENINTRKKRASFCSPSWHPWRRENPKIFQETTAGRLSAGLRKGPLLSAHRHTDTGRMRMGT